MSKFIKFLQLLILVVVGFFLIRDFIAHGIPVFEQPWLIMTVIMTLLLELALFIILKLTEDD